MGSPLIVGVATPLPPSPPAVAVAGVSTAYLSSPRLLLSSSSSATSIGGPCRAREAAFLARSPLLPLPSRHIVVFCRQSAPERTSSPAHSRWAPREGVWEDPDDGHGCEYEEMDDEEEEEEDDREEEEPEGGEMVSEYEGLRREIELLLNPEEKAILQQNEAPDLSKISTRKWKPFHTLALSGQIPFMDKLLETGTDIDAVDKDGLTALHMAVICKKEAVISHLLRKGASPHARDRDGATALHHAVQVGAMQTVKLLIKYKLDVNVADNDGWTPLHVAMQSRSRDIAKVLLVNGADKTRRNKDGKTPLDLSLCYGKAFKSYELAKLLKLVPANRDL